MVELREVFGLQIDYAVERRGRLDVARRGPSVTPGAYCDACGALVCSEGGWMGEPDPLLLRSIRARQRRYMVNLSAITRIEDAPRQLYSEYLAWRGELAERAGRPDYLDIEVGMVIVRACWVALGPGWEERTWVQLTNTRWLVRTPIVLEMKDRGWTGFEWAELPLRSGEPSPFSLVWVTAWRTDMHWLDGVPFSENESRCEQCNSIRPIRFASPVRAAVPANRPDPSVFARTPWGAGGPNVRDDVADWVREKRFSDCRVVEGSVEDSLKRVSIEEREKEFLASLPPPPPLPWE